MTRCPSELELERHLRAPRAEVGRHLGTCERCRGRVAWANAAADTFRREVLPATVDAVIERTRPRRLGWSFWLAPASVAAAAAVALLFLARAPPDDYVGPKGGGLALSVYVRIPGGSRLAADGESVPADAALRFQVRVTRPCHILLASVDGSGRVSRLHPAPGEGARVSGDAVLPGGALLDGRGGPERILAVCSEVPLAFEELERVVAGACRGGDGSVRGLRELAGLPADTLQATLLLEKRAAAP